MLTLSFVDRVAPSSHISDTDTYATFADLVADIKDPEAFKPAESKDELPLFVPAEFGGRRRLASNVLRLHVFVLDFDHGSRADLDEAQKRIGQYGHVCYTSFSHDPNGQKKFRAIVKLSRPVEGTEWLKFWPRAVHELRVSSLVDEHCADAPHMYFMPGGDRAKYEVEGEDGPSLDVDAILQQPLPPGAAEAYDPGLSEPIPESERGEITQGLKDAWNAKLMNSCAELQKRPYPGTIYDLTNGATFGLARGVPHIVGEDRVRNMVRHALDKRYAKHSNHPSVEVDQKRAYEIVDKAIADGKATPWWPLRADEHVSYALTDLGLAERFVEQHHRDVIYEASWKQWLVWDGRHWVVDHGACQVQERMIETVRSITDEAYALAADLVAVKDALEMLDGDPSVSAQTKGTLQMECDALSERVDKFCAFALKAEAAARIRAGIALAASNKLIVGCHDDLDRNPYLVNFENGTLDLRTFVLGPHRRENLITRMVPFAFDPEAKCPGFLRFVDEIMCGRQGLVRYLLALIGYSAIGVTHEQFMVICFGDGANGKSTLMRLLGTVLGLGSAGYAHVANSENLLTDRGGSRHETWRMSLVGRRFVAIQEVDEGRNFNESQVKELTGSDVITGRKMRQDEWSFVPEHTIWLSVNHLPHVRGTDEGIWRRIRVLPFDASFLGRGDKNLLASLEREAVGIWALIAREACRYLLSPELTEPEEVREATKEYRTEEDPLQEFADLHLVETDSEADFLSRSALWGAYQAYCANAGIRTFLTKKKFLGALRKRLRRTHDKDDRSGNDRGFRGLRLRSAEEVHKRSPKGEYMAALTDERMRRPRKEVELIVAAAGSVAALRQFMCRTYSMWFLGLRRLTASTALGFVSSSGWLDVLRWFLFTGCEMRTSGSIGAVDAVRESTAENREGSGRRPGDAATAAQEERA